MAAKSDPQRRPVFYDLRNGRFLADPAIGSSYYPIPALTSGDAAIDLINTATSSVIAAARVVAASTTAAGVVRLSSAVDSASESTAATSQAVKTAYDLADSAGTAAASAVSTANLALSDASAAQATANTAIGDASAAQSTANAALPLAGGTMTGQLVLQEIKEKVYTLPASGSIALDPASGSVQGSVLTGAPTFTDSLEEGQSIVLMLEGGNSYVVTWPSVTWAGSGGNSAPTLTTKDVLIFWKVSTTLYGAYVGTYG